jgi:hypothetical protein
MSANATPASSPIQWQPPTPEELQALLPKYEVDSLIGCGGMGAVYRGRQRALERDVAIKILPPGVETTDASFGVRFRQEALAMAKLNYPGIVAVYDFGQAADGMRYIVMEYVDGIDVAQMLAKKGRLPSKDAMAITAHVCDALKYAHARGIIHRDIKPANIMVGYNGAVKVTDFGLARINLGEQSSFTQSGMAMGTMHYIAPESLILGTSVDHRVDIYALGVMLYQMLTGELPQGMFDLPSHKIPGLDPRYDQIITRTLQNNRDERYPGVEDLRHDLDAILTKPVTQVDPNAAEAPAALKTTARPQRPAGQPYQPLQRQAVSSQKKKSDLAFWGMVVGVVAACAWIVIWAERAKSANGKNVEAVTHGTSKSPPVGNAAKERTFTNSLGMKFVPLPGIKVLMCVHETRKIDYATFASAVPGVNAGWQNPTLDGLPVSTADEHPVVNVSGYDAEAFCRWLSQKDKRIYRLPTWQEWSLAAGVAELEKRDMTYADIRTAVKGRYPWGTEWPPPAKAAGNISDVSLLRANPKAGIIPGYDDGHATTAPVMSYPANELGFFDLAGNVTEWVSEFVTRHDQRKLRGSSWSMGNRPVEHQSSSPGDGGQPLNLRWANIGFRCVLEETAVPNDDLSKAVPMSGEVMIFSGHRYQVVGESCSWTAAAERAREMGGILPRLPALKRLASWRTSPGLICLPVGQAAGWVVSAVDAVSRGPGSLASRLTTTIG